MTMLDLVRVARARATLLRALSPATGPGETGRTARGWTYNETDKLAGRMIERRAAWIEDGCQLSQEVRSL